MATKAESRVAWMSSMSSMSSMRLKKSLFLEESKKEKPAFKAEKKPSNPLENWGEKPTTCLMKNLST